ncbi:MAG: hypothetical protein FWF06_03810 [Symbiobacteriaceae bacterium]|nr:hypothetical protein [Symbiobacteriaceae bacterium]
MPVYHVQQQNHLGDLIYPHSDSRIIWRPDGSSLESIIQSLEGNAPVSPLTVTSFNVTSFTTNRPIPVSFVQSATGAPTGLATGTYYGILTCEAYNGWNTTYGVAMILSIPKLKKTFYRWAYTTTSDWPAWGEIRAV